MSKEREQLGLPYEWVGHTWAEESVYDSNGDQLCTANIRDDATEDTQEALEAKMTARMKFIVRACNAYHGLVEDLEKAQTALAEQRRMNDE